MENVGRDIDATSVTRATYDRIASRNAECQESDHTNGPSLFEELESAFYCVCGMTESCWMLVVARDSTEFASLSEGGE
jgi:hypothetical protein